jgi:membrane-bound serine protease (ClpP class)
MAPGTNLGAATPVAIGGPDALPSPPTPPGKDKVADKGETPAKEGKSDEAMSRKQVHDAAAYIRGLAQLHGRNVEWAERVVRESISSTAEEAVAERVADFVAADLDELLSRLDGRSTSTPDGEVVIRAAGATVEEVPPTFRERFLARIADPNVAYVLMLIGIFGIIFELQNPGAILPGVAGAVAMVTAAFALQMLPISWTGVALIVLAIALFILEIKVASHGLLTIGGVVSMIIGSIMLIDSPLPFMRVSLAVIIPSVAFTALFFLFAVGMGIKAQRRKVTTGSEGLVGEVGTARTAIAPEGTVFVRGELWNARSDESVALGDEVEVTAVDGMKVSVRRRPRA